MQTSLNSQLQSLQAQIAGLQGGSSGLPGVLGPSTAYNTVPVPHFKPCAAAPPAACQSVAATTAFGALSEVQNLQPLPPVPESAGKKSYLFVAILVLVALLLIGAGVWYFLKRRAAKKLQEEEAQLKAFAAQLEEKQLEDEQREQEAALAAASARKAAEAMDRQRQQMQEQVAASLQARAAPKFVPFASVSPVRSSPKIEEVGPDEEAVATPVKPGGDTPGVLAVSGGGSADDPFRSGKQFLDKAISNVSTSIKTSLQQAILAQKTYAPDVQRDESVLHNQGELGLAVAGANTFVLHKDVLEGEVSVHPTGEKPLSEPLPSTPTLAEV